MEINPDLLKKYGAGTCTSEEQKLVEEWLNHENAGTHYDFMPGTDLETEKAKLIDAIDMHLAKRKRRFWFRPASIAALWFVFVTIGFYSYHIGMFSFNGSTPEYKTVHVPVGKKISVVLPDGSKAYLNSGSTLTYPKAFEGPQRLLALDGEAFFEVVKQAGKPFIVEAHGTRTEVLGTRFNLNSFESEGETNLTVEQGKVMFTASDSRDTLVLVANNRATHQKGQLQMDEIAGHEDSGWKDGRLIFNHSTIAEMVPILERWYGVSIIVSDPKLNEYRMKIKYENPSLRRVLEDVAYATDIRFKIVGKNVTIYP
ncbi:FecR family protein [Sphingobacterium sp. JB170]|uniref:FecR family protein n=1 Tax=Sphingobacterium sp. JB170 TaxID=1434842 RepID=UPI001179D49F|nr:FecR domain-containing protein [Sphingobacterium sp. JB170]